MLNKRALKDDQHQPISKKIKTEAQPSPTQPSSSSSTTADLPASSSIEKPQEDPIHLAARRSLAIAMMCSHNKLHSDGGFTPEAQQKREQVLKMLKDIPPANNTPAHGQENGGPVSGGVSPSTTLPNITLADEAASGADQHTPREDNKIYPVIVRHNNEDVSKLNKVILTTSHGATFQYKTSPPAEDVYQQKWNSIMNETVFSPQNQLNKISKCIKDSCPTPNLRLNMQINVLMATIYTILVKREECRWHLKQTIADTTQQRLVSRFTADADTELSPLVFCALKQQSSAECTFKFDRDPDSSRMVYIDVTMELKNE